MPLVRVWSGKPVPKSDLIIRKRNIGVRALKTPAYEGVLGRAIKVAQKKQVDAGLVRSPASRKKIMEDYAKVKDRWKAASKRYRARKRAAKVRAKAPGYKHALHMANLAAEGKLQKRKHKPQKYYTYVYKEPKMASKKMLDDLMIATGDIMANIAQDILFNLRGDPLDTGTPVDTGWTRENWVIGVSRNTPRVPIGHRPPSGVPFPGADPRLEYLQSYNVLQGDLKVVNNVPYLQILNARGGGRSGGKRPSPKTPPRFIERSIAKANVNRENFVSLE